MPLRRTTPSLVAVTAAAALAAGCGGDARTVRATDREVVFRHAEYELEPPVVRARRGRLTLVSRNEGLLAHNVKVQGRGREWGGTDTVKPGETSRVTLRLPPGSYRIYCSVGQHDLLGEYGSLRVR